MTKIYRVEYECDLCRTRCSEGVSETQWPAGWARVLLDHPHLHGADVEGHLCGDCLQRVWSLDNEAKKTLQEWRGIAESSLYRLHQAGQEKGLSKARCRELADLLKEKFYGTRRKQDG